MATTGPMPPDQAGSTFQPYVPASQTIAEVTVKSVVLGAILSVVFGVANAYLALKYGMTVSASIPAAVMSMAMSRWRPGLRSRSRSFSSGRRSLGWPDSWRRWAMRAG